MQIIHLSNYLYCPATPLRRLAIVFLCLSVFAGWGCTDQKEQDGTTLLEKSWEEIVEQARGQTVTMMMWKGDQNINNYMQNYVRPAMKKKYDINLKIAGGQGNTIISILMKELEAGQATSELDMMWINGETFYQLRRINALFGPFVEHLPNAKFLDLEDPFVRYDFQQAIEGYECPWGTVQFTMIYDTTQLQNPPRTMQELERFVKEHPGRFTISNDFTGMTFLKSILISMAGPDALQGTFDPEKYKKYSTRLWEYLNRIKPYLWRTGKTFPSSVSEMHRLYANGEIWITMSNNEAEADNKVEEGMFPSTSRAYALDSGTIRNSHYVGIPKHSNRKAGAMVVANFLISPAAQLEKLKPRVWGDGTVLNPSALPTQWRQKFEQVAELDHAPSRSMLREKALRELAPKYMIRLYEDFRKHIIQ